MAGRQTRLFRKAVIIREDGVRASKRAGKNPVIVLFGDIQSRRRQSNPVVKKRRNAFDVLLRWKNDAFILFGNHYRARVN